MEWIKQFVFPYTSPTKDRIDKGSNSNSKTNQLNFLCLCTCELQYLWLHTIESLILEPLFFSNLPPPRFFPPLISISAKASWANMLTVCLTSSRPLILSFFQGSSPATFSTFRGVVFLLNFLVSVCGMSWSTHKDVTLSRQVHEKPTVHPEVFLNYIALFISSINGTSMTRHFLNRLVLF